MSRWRYALVLLLISPSLVSAAQDAEADRPYPLKIVLGVARHRLLTPVFREQVQRELQEGLGAFLRPLAEVQVVTEHPRLAQIQRQGLGKVLDDWLDVDEVKTHFVQIDYADGAYVIQTRQHCGITGQSSPVVRRERTTDRQFVSRLAALMIDRDLGLVGSLIERTDPNNIRVALRGSALEPTLGGRIKRGDLLLVTPVPPGGRTAPPVRLDEAAVLQVQGSPENGVVSCRLFARYQNPLGGSANYRCLHIATIKTPVRVRLMEQGAKTPTPVPGTLVQVRARGFDAAEEPKIVGSTDGDGYLLAGRGRNEEFQGVAFVTIETRPAVQIPLLLVDNRTVNLRVKAIPPDARTLVQENRELWERQAEDAGFVQRSLFKELSQLGEKVDQRAKALDRAQKGLEITRASLVRLKQEREELAKEAQGSGSTLDMSYGDGWLKVLEKGEKQLQDYIAAQNKILKEENDPRRREWLALIERAKLEEGQFEFGKALELYDRMVNDFKEFEDADLKARRDRLKAQWTPKNEEHRRARIFIYETWPKVDLAAAPDVLKEATSALNVCRSAGDVLSPRKLLQVAIDQGASLAKQREELQPDINEADRTRFEAIGNVSKDLRDLILNAKAYLEERSEK